MNVSVSLVEKNRAEFCKININVTRYNEGIRGHSRHSRGHKPFDRDDKMLMAVHIEFNDDIITITITIIVIKRYFIPTVDIFERWHVRLPFYRNKCMYSINTF